MIDLAWLRAYPELAKESQIKRGEDPRLVDAILEADTQRRKTINAADNLRAEHKILSKSIAQAPPAERGALIDQANALIAQLKDLEAQEHAHSEQAAQLHLRISNVVDESVPVGGEDDFTVIKEVGVPGDNQHLADKDHTDIMHELGMLDSERGTKVGGSRFYFLTGYGALLEMALIRMGVDLAHEAGFTIVIPPVLVKPEIMQGTGFLGEHADEIYHLPTDDLYLVGTSEVALAGMHAHEILNVDQLPLRYAGVSTCFRREAGSYGKDTRGIIRVHQFNKLEMFIYCTPEQAHEEHHKLLAWEEAMLQAIEVPYRVIDIAAGDLGTSAARKYDCEAWIPSQNCYRELTSTSNCTTFQARRLGIRYKVDKKTHPVATLNGTLATTRWLVAIVENHYRNDGTIVVPAQLAKYLGTDMITCSNTAKNKD